MITQTLQLNLVPKGVWPRLYVSQYDAGSRTLTFEIYNGDQRFTLTSGTTAKIQGTKPDRHGFSYDADVDTSNNVITADITQQMTAAHGEAYCELVLFKSGQRIGTLNFVMMIQQAGLNDETDTSDSDLPDIIAEATEQMLTAEAYAKGTRNGTAVTSGQTGYHDNSKYYKEQAATQASNASTSATNANTNALKAEGYAVGKQNGTTQTSGTYYHNNAQYYKEQAASSATTASTKAGEASTSANTASQKASAASTSAQTASDKALVAEGYAKGTQNGTPVGSTSPYYHNNAEYFKNLANPTVAANVSFNNSGTDMSSTNVQDGIVENRTSIQNLSTVVSKNGAKNFVALNRSPDKAQISYNLASITNQTEDSVTLTSNEASYACLRLYYMLPAGQYIVSYDFESDDTSYQPAVTIYREGNQVIPGGNNILKNEQRVITVQEGYEHLDIRLFITKDAVVRTGTFKNLMIRLASDTDGTYEPYAKTNVELTADSLAAIDNRNILGAKNLCPNTAVSKEINNVVWTVNSDGTVTANGTLTANNSSVLVINTFTGNEAFVGKNVIVSGSPSGGGDTTHRITAYRAESVDGSSGTAFDTGSGVIVNWKNNGSGTKAKIQLEVLAGNEARTISNLTFKPMIRLASDTDPTYEPYAKSNKELTEEVATINGHGYTLLGNGNVQNNNTIFPAEQMTNIKCYADPVLRRAAVKFSALVSSQALTKNSAVGVCYCYNGYAAKGFAMNNFGYAEKDGNVYLFVLGKSAENTIIALTPLDDIPSGATFKGFLEWYY